MVKEIGNRVRRLRALALGLLLGSSHIALNAGNAGAQQVGTSAAVQGDVFVSAAGADTRRAQISDEIQLGDEVLTKQQSALQILLLDASIFTIGENCEMTIDRFVYDPDVGAGQMSARVARGAFRFMSGRIGHEDPTQASISTPSATIGIRGTFLEGVTGEDAVRLISDLGICDVTNVNPALASLVVLRGPGNDTNTLDQPGEITISNATGTTTVSEANYAVFTPGPDSEPCVFEMPEEMRDYLDFYLRSVPNGPPVDLADTEESGEDNSQQDYFNEPPDDETEEGDETIQETLEEDPPPPYDDDHGGGDTT